MLRFNQASSQQKDFIQSFFNVMLRITNCSEHYRIEMKDDYLFIRESTQNPPPMRYRERFQKLTQALNELGLVAIEKSNMMAMIQNKIINIPRIKIAALNPELIDRIIRKNHSSDKPREIDERLWAVLPDEIKLRWHRFNEAMQAHIAKCMSVNLEEKFDHLLTTQVLGNTFRSPIGLEAPKIPVRLPNNRLENGVSNEVYDLTEILNIKERHPSDPALRRDPVTRDYFSLKDVIAAPDALEKLHERAMANYKP